ncbi:hypothetical protein B0H13DRAFT_2370902 [Mycena leptocephala]|nr:hypothetical protein B0H13DRAFT_2370902 [Mycena leptocephala]
MPPVSILLVVPTLSSALWHSQHDDIAHSSLPPSSPKLFASAWLAQQCPRELIGNWVLKEVRAAHISHANHAQPYREHQIKRKNSPQLGRQRYLFAVAFEIYSLKISRGGTKTWI